MGRGARVGAHLFQPGNLAAKGHGQAKFSKPYSEAATQWLTMRNGLPFPSSWPEDRADWTFAQAMVERHASTALVDLEMAKWLVERSEGKTPIAPEDREAKMKSDAAAFAVLGGLTAVQALREILGLPKKALDIGKIDTEVVE